MEWEPRKKEFFECDCYGKDHLIRAEYSEFILRYKDDTTHKDRDLDICFETRLADYDNVHLMDNKFIQFKDRWIWRIKHAFKILFKGEITTEGYFMPCRSLVDSHKDRIENLFGYQTTKNFAKWLDTMADKIKADYEQDMKDYTTESMTKELKSDEVVGHKFGSEA
jgi:hypothetical protein